MAYATPTPDTNAAVTTQAQSAIQISAIAIDRGARHFTRHGEHVARRPRHSARYHPHKPARDARQLANRTNGCDTADELYAIGAFAIVYDASDFAKMPNGAGTQNFCFI